MLLHTFRRFSVSKRCTGGTGEEGFFITCWVGDLVLSVPRITRVLLFNNSFSINATSRIHTLQNQLLYCCKHGTVFVFFPSLALPSCRCWLACWLWINSRNDWHLSFSCKSDSTGSKSESATYNKDKCQVMKTMRSCSSFHFVYGGENRGR
jgi:hypothetical protein